MAKHDYTYEVAQAYVKNKNKAVSTFIESALDRTLQIFTYANLPDTMPQTELENILQRNGHGIVAKVDDEIYMLKGTLGGEVDAYEHPTKYVVANVGLKHNKEYTLGIDCVFFKNDYNAIGMLPMIMKYAALMTDTEITLNTVAVLSRISMLITAPDDKTKASADLFVKHILDGDFSVIGENAFFDGVKMHTSSTTNGNLITQLLELMQYYKGSFYNEMGLQANFNMKRESLNSAEVALNIDTLLPFIENMYNERVAAITAINEMFGTDIVVDYNSAWKATQEHADQEEITVDTDTTSIDEDVEAMEDSVEEIKEDETISETQEPQQEDEALSDSAATQDVEQQQETSEYEDSEVEEREKSKGNS